MTRRFGVIGHPIGHSRSPAMHAAALRALRLDAHYGAFDVPRRFLAPMLDALVLAGLEGLNVTVPLKEAVLPLLDRVEASARAVGAVNTIVIRNRRLTGYNTDVEGFRRAVGDLGWRPRRGARVLVLGAGGAARAVVWALARRPDIHITVANRHAGRAAALVHGLRRRGARGTLRAVPLRQARPGEADLIVNATSLGMRRADRMPLNPRALRRTTVVYDLVYHRETPLVRAARRRGCVAAGGGSMLLYQGAASLRLWLRRTPPLTPMRRALAAALRRSRRAD